MKNRGKQIANCTIAISAGLVSLIFSTRFFPIGESWLLGGIFASAGILAVAWAWYNWQQLE